MTGTRVFDLIDRLVDAQPFDPAQVGKILGTPLARDEESDTAAVEAWSQPESAAAGRYTSVDLRMPDPDIGDGSIFLSVTLSGDEGVDESMIGERFGLDFETEVPSPRFPPGAVPVYLSYGREWGSLSFGVSVDERKLVRFILSTHPTNADEEA